MCNSLTNWITDTISAWLSTASIVQNTFALFCLASSIVTTSKNEKYAQPKSVISSRTSWITKLRWEMAGLHHNFCEFYIFKSSMNVISKHMEEVKLQNFIGIFTSNNPTRRAYDSLPDTATELFTACSSAAPLSVNGILFLILLDASFFLNYTLV